MAASCATLYRLSYITLSGFSGDDITDTLEMPLSAEQVPSCLSSGVDAAIKGTFIGTLFIDILFQ